MRSLPETLMSNGFRTLLNYPNDFKFDLILYDFTTGQCLLPFLHKFNYPPLVAVTAFSHPSYLVDLVGGHHYYAYVPHNVFFFEKDMLFWQRFLNFAVYVEEYVYGNPICKCINVFNGHFFSLFLVACVNTISVHESMR